MPILQQRPSQIGGLSGDGTDLGSHAVRAAMSWAKTVRHFGGVSFC